VLHPLWEELCSISAVLEVRLQRLGLDGKLDTLGIPLQDLLTEAADWVFPRSEDIPSVLAAVAVLGQAKSTRVGVDRIEVVHSVDFHVAEAVGKSSRTDLRAVGRRTEVAVPVEKEEYRLRFAASVVGVELE
jgi:hypothetical protein